MQKENTREIKFRFWNKLTEKIQDDMAWDSGYVNEMLADPDMVPMQFTGLTDKNGKEIYEGDIVRAFYWEGERKKHFGSTLDIPDGENEDLSIIKWQPTRFYLDGAIVSKSVGDIHQDDIEIIGNIYENPELIN